MRAILSSPGLGAAAAERSCGGTETMAQFRLVKLLSTDAAPARPLSLCSCFIHALKAHFLDS